MEILAQPLCETVFTPSTFRHTKRLPIRISKPSHKKFHFKNFELIITMKFEVTANNIPNYQFGFKENHSPVNYFSQQRARK
jgi:hypothetical protein